MPYLSQFMLVLVLIFFNAFFVAAEYSLLNLRKTKIDQYVRHNTLGFMWVRRALDQMFAVISATQLGSTLCSILIGWYGEPMIEGVLAPLLKLLPYHPNKILLQSISIVVTLTLLSFMQIIFGEMIPKAIALQKSEFVSRLLILPLNFFTFLFSPFILITNGVAGFFLKLMKLRSVSKEQMDYTEEEIKVIVSESKKSRTLSSHQAHLLTNILILQTTPLTKLLVDREKLVSFNHDDTLETIRKKVAENKHSYNRYPVYFSENLLVGYIHISDIIRFPENGESKKKLNGTKLIREILHVHDSFPADKLLVQMREKGIHVASVTNQDQELLGIVTLADIIQFVVTHR